MTVELPETPENRKEQYLANIAGQDVVLPEEPANRIETYLAYIAENGGGGGGGGEGAKALTSADFNYDPEGSGTNTAIGLWLMPDGVYTYDASIAEFVCATTTDIANGECGYIIVQTIDADSKSIWDVCSSIPIGYTVEKTSGDQWDKRILTTTNNMRTFVDDRIGNFIAYSEEGAPTTDTRGTLGQLLTDLTTMHTYQLTAIDDSGEEPVYTWTQRW